MTRLVLALALFIALPAAAADIPARVTGTIDAVDGSTLTLLTAEKGPATFALPDDVRVTRTVSATIADVKENQFIGCTAVEGPDGKLYAQEIHIIPEDMRGAGEGHYPWGDAPGTTMTNGNVEQLEGIAKGHIVKVSYKGGESEIEIPPGIAVTRIETAPRGALKPGLEVSVFEKPGGGSPPAAQYVSIIEDRAGE